MPEAPWHDIGETALQDIDAIKELGRLSANLSALLAGMSTPDAVQKHRGNLENKLRAFLEVAGGFTLTTKPSADELMLKREIGR